MSKQPQPFPYEISIVIPCFNEEDNIPVIYRELKKWLKNETYEVVFVDDGSTDGSLAVLQQLAASHKNIKYISFSRNFGHQAALRAGLRGASGRAVISMDADLQHPAKLLPQLLDEWRSGYDVVYTVRKDTSETGAFKRFTSRQFYRWMNYLSDLHIDEGAADFRLLDRKVVTVINRQQESELFLRGYISWLGFNQKAVLYEPAKRFSGQSKYTLRKMLNLATHGVTQFSVKPLRLSIIVGLTFAILGALYGIYAVISYFTSNTVASGWTSLTVLILITSGIQLVLLGVVGEYVGRTFVQTKNRPDYLVSRTNVEDL